LVMTAAILVVLEHTYLNWPDFYADVVLWLTCIFFIVDYSIMNQLPCPYFRMATHLSVLNVLGFEFYDQHKARPQSQTTPRPLLPPTFNCGHHFITNWSLPCLCGHSIFQAYQSPKQIGYSARISQASTLQTCYVASKKLCRRR
jgi:hypothetical protein